MCQSSNILTITCRFHLHCINVQPEITFMTLTHTKHHDTNEFSFTLCVFTGPLHKSHKWCLTESGDTRDFPPTNSLASTLCRNKRARFLTDIFLESTQPLHTSEAELNNWYFTGMKRVKFARQRSDSYNSNGVIQNASLCLWRFIWVCWTGSSRMHQELRKMDGRDSGLSVARPITFPLAFIIRAACLFSATLGLHIWICLI